MTQQSLSTPFVPICQHALRVRLRTAQLVHLRGKIQSLIVGLEAGSIPADLAARILQRSLDEAEAMAAQEALDLSSDQPEWRG